MEIGHFSTARADWPFPYCPCRLALSVGQAVSPASASALVPAQAFRKETATEPRPRGSGASGSLLATEAERSPETAGVGGSIPSLATMFSETYRHSKTQFHSISFQNFCPSRFALAGMRYVWRGFLGAGSLSHPALFISLEAWNLRNHRNHCNHLITTAAPSSLAAEGSQLLSAPFPCARWYEAPRRQRQFVAHL